MRALVFVALVGCGSDSPDKPDAAVAVDAAVMVDALDKATALTVTMQATRTLNRGFYGVNGNEGTLHVEVNLGGVSTCPEMNSPTPDYTAIFAAVPTTGTSGTTGGSFLDYQMDMIPDEAPFEGATSINISAITYQASMFVAFDTTMTFPSGTAMGHVYAIHCTSMDVP